jgi:hypothetical protein
MFIFEDIRIHMETKNGKIYQIPFVLTQLGLIRHDCLGDVPTLDPGQNQVDPGLSLKTSD